MCENLVAVTTQIDFSKILLKSGGSWCVRPTEADQHAAAWASLVLPPLATTPPTRCLDLMQPGPDSSTNAATPTGNPVAPTCSG